MTLYHNLYAADTGKGSEAEPVEERNTLTATSSSRQRIDGRPHSPDPSDAQPPYPQGIMARSTVPDGISAGSATGNPQSGAGSAYPPSSTPHPASLLPNVPFARDGWPRSADQKTIPLCADYNKIAATLCSDGSRVSQANLTQKFPQSATSANK